GMQECGRGVDFKPSKSTPRKYFRETSGLPSVSSRLVVNAPIVTIVVLIVIDLSLADDLHAPVSVAASDLDCLAAVLIERAALVNHVAVAVAADLVPSGVVLATD